MRCIIFRTARNIISHFGFIIFLISTKVSGRPFSCFSFSQLIRSFTTTWSSISFIILFGVLVLSFYIFWKINTASFKFNAFLLSFANATSITFPESLILLEKRLWLRCFPVNLAKFLRTPFLQNQKTSASGSSDQFIDHWNTTETTIIF